MLKSNRGRYVLLAGIVGVALMSAASAMGTRPSVPEIESSGSTLDARPHGEVTAAYKIRRSGASVEVIEHKLADDTPCVTTIYVGYTASTVCGWIQK